MIISATQQNDSVIHIHTSILFQILFPHRLSRNIGYHFLCYTVGPCWPVIPYTSVCICQYQTSVCPSSYPQPFGNLMFVFKVCKSVSVLEISSFVSFFKICGPLKKFFIHNFYFFHYVGLQCSVNFLLFRKVTQSHIHVYIFFSHYRVAHFLKQLVFLFTF